jgi:hypothetical protein
MNFLKDEILDKSNKNYIREIRFWTHFSGEICYDVLNVSAKNYSKIHIDQIKGLKLRVSGVT